MEVLTRFELVNEGFADLCLTTWPQHRIWSGLRGSNSLPPPWQGGALPDELKPLTCLCIAVVTSDDIYFTAYMLFCQHIFKTLFSISSICAMRSNLNKTGNFFY